MPAPCEGEAGRPAQAGPVVAFQGEPGAYSEAAAVATFGPAAVLLPCASFDTLFAAVAEGQATRGLVPVENSLAGTVRESWDLLVAYELPIVAEVRLPVRHCLLAVPGTALADVKVAASHPQALAQSAAFLADHGITPRAAYDTAGAARELASRPEPGVAAIASARAATLYGLDVLAEAIQGREDNTTRFYVIARPGEVPPAGDKATLVFGAAHRPGGLAGALAMIASHGLNMTMIESRPTRETPWQYRFHVDLDAAGSPIAPDTLAAVVAELGGPAAGARLLGLYQAAS